MSNSVENVVAITLYAIFIAIVVALSLGSLVTRVLVVVVAVRNPVGDTAG